MRLGHGSGNMFPAGSIDGTAVNAYTSEKGHADPERLLEVASEIIDEYAVMSDPKTNPGIVVSEDRLPHRMYSEALSREIRRESVENFLVKSGIHYVKFKDGRGIIGAASALGWNMRKVTYELLTYRYPRPDYTPADLRMEAASFIDENYPETFNNVDVRNRHAVIFPSNKTPVIYGVRSTRPESLFSARRSVSKKFGIHDERDMVFATNQGTDDHIIHDPVEIWEYGSFALKGEITVEPFSIRGGHYFSFMSWKSRLVRLAAFEPTKEFREVFRSLRPGDRIEVTGSYSGDAIKVEKLTVLSVSGYFRRKQPQCPSCGERMKTHGRHDFRCRECGTRSSMPEYSEEARTIKPGSYEVPVSARRHLSMPLKLAPYFSTETPQLKRGEMA